MHIMRYSVQVHISNTEAMIKKNAQVCLEIWDWPFTFMPYACAHFTVHTEMKGLTSVAVSKPPLISFLETYLRGNPTVNSWLSWGSKSWGVRTCVNLLAIIAHSEPWDKTLSSLFPGEMFNDPTGVGGELRKEKVRKQLLRCFIPLSGFPPHSR